MAFLTTSPLINLRHLVFFSRLLAEGSVVPGLERVPDLFSHELFPVLVKIQLESFKWPLKSRPQYVLIFG